MLEQLLTLSEDRSVINFIVPDDVTISEKLTHQHFIDVIHTLGAQDYYIYNDEIENIITALNSGELSKEHEAIIAQRLNAQISIQLAEDEMLATMTVTGAYAGSHVRGPAIIAALSEHSILKGIQKDALKTLLIKNKDLLPGESYTDTIAVGKAPIIGNDTVFLPLVPDVKKRILQPKETEDGQVDMRDLGDFITVKAGSPLLKRIPASRGTEGITVTGKRVPSTPGTDYPFKVYSGSLISNHDENLLIAEVDGMPIIHSDGVSVDNVLTVKSVGVTTGHISFEGSIVVEKDIEAGMKVNATGSITVGGFVENAEVHAGGDITVVNGVIGRQVSEEEEELACVMIAKGNITAKLAQHAHLIAHQDINLLVLSNHCHLEALGSISVIDRSEKNGTISGGSASAHHSIKAANLGIEGGAYTKIQAFSGFHDEKESLHELQKRHHEILAQIDKIAQINIEQQPSELAEKVLRSKEKVEKDLVDVRRTIEKEQITFDNSLKQKYITVTNKMFPRVEIQFNTEKLVTKREYSPSKITFTGYEIEVDPILTKKKYEQKVKPS